MFYTIKKILKKIIIHFDRVVDLKIECNYMFDAVQPDRQVEHTKIV